MVLYIISACVIVGAIGLTFHRRRKYKALRWPKELGIFKFNRLVTAFLIKRKWDVHQGSSIPYFLWARKDGGMVAIHCIPTMDEMTINRVALVIEHNRLTGGKVLICISANIIETAVQLEAFRQDLHLIHYSELPGLAGVASTKAEILEEYFTFRKNEFLAVHAANLRAVADANAGSAHLFS